MIPLVLRAGPLEAEQVDQVHRLVALATDADGVEPLGEQTLLDLSDPSTVHAIADDGDLVGYGQLGPRHGAARTIELVVAPDSRRTGIGSRLLDALLTTSRDTGDDLRLWTHGSLPASRVLAQRRGLVPVRELWRMSLPFGGAGSARTAAPATGAPPHADHARPVLPSGARLRQFVPGEDEQAWLAANAAAFVHHPEQGSLTLDDLLARMREPWFAAEDLLLADGGAGGLLGFAWTKVTPPIGELYALGVLPAAQGIGLGRALTEAALDHLRARGVDRAVLFSDADNVPAVRTYAAAGFVTDRVDTQYAPGPRPGGR